jgi:hypothetical protein
MSSFKHPEYLSQEQISLFDKLATIVADKRLTMPAILFLESVSPLNFVGSQAMLFFAPMIHAFFTARQYDLIQQALERRETIAYLIDLLEIKEIGAAQREKEIRAEIKAEKKARRELRRQKRASK